MRKGMWEHVASRDHKPLKVFPFGPDANEVMLQGTVSYGLKNGKPASVDWAAHAHLVKQGSDVKMSFYQVYLVGFSHLKVDEPCLFGTRTLPPRLQRGERLRSGAVKNIARQPRLLHKLEL
jgi:hypothetical protein